MEKLITNGMSVLEGISSRFDMLASADVTMAISSTAQEVSEGLFTANNIWMMLCTALVFIMHLGFAGVEAGFTQSKNTVNILFKNTMTPVIGIITYAFIGFNLMYPDTFVADTGGEVFGFDGWFIGTDAAGLTIDYVGGGYTYWTDFLFQAMFAATAATIVSGAVAERIKLSSYLIFTVLFVGVVYPIVGSWDWGYGWLDDKGFTDFAGSTLVHSVGGWGALAGIIVLGPRIGKYENGKINDFPGSSVPLSTIGVFLLWLGWFGFNGGSVLSADPALTSLVLVTTCLGASAGALGGFLAAFFVFKRMDLGMVLNGILAGLVGITASADVITPGEALLIGFIAGLLVVISAVTLDRLKLDDCVGAVSVHLTCGIWGTLATGIFGEGVSFGPQLIGVLAIGATAFGSALIIFKVLDLIQGIRVSKEHELEGLDSHEHGIRGYTIIVE